MGICCDAVMSDPEEVKAILLEEGVEEETIDAAKAVFELLDEDGGGELEFMEVYCRLNDFGLDEDEIDSVFSEMDTDGDGKVALLEFVRAFALFKSKGAYFDVFEISEDMV